MCVVCVKLKVKKFQDLGIHGTNRLLVGPRLLNTHNVCISEQDNAGGSYLGRQARYK